MIEFAPLIAGIKSLIIPALIFFFIFLINAVSQMAKKGQQGQQQRGPNPQQPRANVPRPPPARQPAAGQPAGGVADEINSFLNRLTQPQGQQQPPAQQRPAPQRPVRQPPPATARLVDSSRPVEAEVITLSERQSVGGHVKSHLGSRELGQRLPTHLEGKAAQADDKMEARLHGVFDHGIGSLAHEEQDSLELQEQGDPAGEIPATAAAGLAAMFANPGNIRQAIIMQEVLNRPIDRWS